MTFFSNLTEGSKCSFQDIFYKIKKPRENIVSVGHIQQHSRDKKELDPSPHLKKQKKIIRRILIFRFEWQKERKKKKTGINYPEYRFSYASIFDYSISEIVHLYIKWKLVFCIFQIHVYSYCNLWKLDKLCIAHFTVRQLLNK